ncbi:MAG: CBS domain-containing protein [Burkholderiales bacterium]|nr:MAG: CBS domain-containing protein [Burkholderiales bacterium]
MTSPTILAGVRRSLAAHSPYSELDEDALDFVARRVELTYFARGERIVGPSDGPPARCWIVRQGLVEGRRPGRPDEPPASTLTPGDTFPVGALMAERPVVSDYWAVGDVFCWALAKTDFDALITRSPAFLDFCKRRMGALLDLSNRALQASYAQQATQWRSMATPLGDLLRRAPVTVPADMALREVFELMERERVGSVIVGDAQGIFTRQDVIGRVALPGVPLEAPIASVMTSPVLALDARATIAEAMLLMAERTIRHVPVRRDGVLAGVVTERDLFVLQRQTLRGIGEAIGAASSTAALARAAEDIREWSSTLVAQGVASAFVTRLISRLNDQVAQRAIGRAAAAHGVSLEGVCWLALGSEGREEQTIATDQDNGLVFDDATDEAGRDRLRAFAESVNAELDACGYPLCKGGIMAGNPKWCLARRDWEALFEGWIDRGDPQSLLAASVFFDFRPLAGDASLAIGLRERVTVRAAANGRFLKQMSDNARRNGPPTSWTGGLIGQLFTHDTPEVDLKLHGTVPFVDAARLLALAHGVRATGTAERLQALADAGTLPPGETHAWIEAFQFLQSLRLRVQHQRPGSVANPNLLDTRILSDLDRRILKEAFRQARTLQQRLALDWPG